MKAYAIAIHICNSHEPRLTKNCKRICLTNAQEEMKIAANLKDKMIENKECQWVTMHISHWAIGS